MRCSDIDDAGHPIPGAILGVARRARLGAVGSGIAGRTVSAGVLKIPGFVMGDVVAIRTRAASI